MAARPTTAKDEKILMTKLWDPALADNLEKFVMFVYPWGKPNTPLYNFKEPRTWQRDELQKITAHIDMNKTRIKDKLTPLVYRSATVSGRGVGKSAFVSWINHWMMTCRLGSTAINTANTEDQLKSKTWAEVRKWHTLSINSHWFEPMALSLRPSEWFKEAVEKQLKIDTGYYYANAQLWSEEKPDSFAGAHNHNGMLVVFDEASGIPKPIWTVSEGFFTEPVLHRYWFVFSNGRRNTGPFFECFNANRNFWIRRNLDSRTVEGTDKEVLNQIIAQHGDDSDEARIEVKGQFPNQSDDQFISKSIVQDAVTRELALDNWAPVFMGVDPARKGSDETVIRFRQGRNARVIPPLVLKGKDNMEVANFCADLINRYNPDAVCVDAGNGTGIIDRLRERGFKIHEVWFGAASIKPQWGNKRTELWAEMRDWLSGACIDNNQDLIDDLTNPFYQHQKNTDKIILEPKDDMRSRGLNSPDNGDALACTFAVKVAHRNTTVSRGGHKKARVAQDVDYNIFGR